MSSTISILLIILTSIYSLVALAFLIGLFLPRQGRNREKHSVSVVLAARDEEDSIADCLSDLVSQTYPKGNYEIIVVDDGSQDGTSQIVEGFCRQYPNVRLLKAPSVSPGFSPKKSALNAGIKNSTSEIILTTDADCRLKSTWIETMIKYFDPEVGMVIGFSQMGEKGENLSLFEKLQSLDFLSLMAATAGATNIGVPLGASGQNLAYRREVFEQVGGFKRIAQRISGDDVLLVQLVRRTPWRIAFAASKDSFNSTPPERTIRDLINQRKRWASNGSYQYKLNKPFFLYIISVFFLNLLLLPTVLYSLLSSGRFTIPLFCLAAKTLADLCVILRGGQVYDRLDLVRYFPLWAALHIPYIVFAGIFGTFGSFTWKDRQH